MQESELRRLATEYLIPFFSGASLLSRSTSSSPAQQEFSFVDPQTIAFKVRRSDPYRLSVRRPQPFARLGSSGVVEWDVIASFVVAVRAIESGLGTEFEADVLASLQQRVVANALQISDANTVLAVIEQLSRWATRLYEGSPVVAGLGLADENALAGISLNDLKGEAFAQVLTNGFDTLLAFNFDGDFVRYEALQPPSVSISFAPARYGAIAEWATEGRIAFSLNRLGEILVFRDQSLVFARRAGVWHFLTHDPIISQMRVPSNRDVRRAIYESALDASFARTGACIGVASRASLHGWKSIATSTEDHLAAPTSTKSKTLAEVISGRSFQDLDRRTRLEILALDGATVLAPDGKILAAGTILKVGGGSRGGGRQAAAVEVSKLGLGIKVSQDGGITGYHEGKSVPVLALM